VYAADEAGAEESDPELIPALPRLAQGPERLRHGDEDLAVAAPRAMFERRQDLVEGKRPVTIGRGSIRPKPSV